MLETAIKQEEIKGTQLLGFYGARTLEIMKHLQETDIKL